MGKAPSVKRVKESAIERDLREQVEIRGGICEKVMCVGKRGFFDRLIILPGGKVIFAEIKRPRGGRISPHQRQYYDLYRRLGVVVAFVRNRTDIDALLKN
jgi:hypothetical protein